MGRLSRQKWHQPHRDAQGGLPVDHSAVTPHSVHRSSWTARQGRSRTSTDDAPTDRPAPAFGDLAFARTTRGGYARRGRMVGKAMTSRIEGLSVNSMISRSIPSPIPPVGGMPYSSAVT